MSVGVRALDMDHKLILSLINQFDEAIGNGEGEDTVSGVISALHDYTVQHFGREEEMMAACGYPDLEAHKKIHAGLSDKVREIRDKLDKEGVAGIDQEILTFMNTWLTDHIMGTDKTYAPFLNGKRDMLQAAERKFSEKAKRA